MRALSANQVKTCEQSTRRRCKCRCHGAMHGVRQNGYVQLLLVPEDQNAHLSNPCYCIEADCTAPVHLAAP